MCRVDCLNQDYQGFGMDRIIFSLPIVLYGITEIFSKISSNPAGLNATNGLSHKNPNNPDSDNRHDT